MDGNVFEIIGKKYNIEWERNNDQTTRIKSIDINIPIFNRRSNCRDLDIKRVNDIINSITSGGYTGNICITKNGNEIVNGHHLIESLKKIGFKNVNVATIINKNPDIEKDAWDLTCWSFSINRVSGEEGMTHWQVLQFINRGYKRYNTVYGENNWNLKQLANDLNMAINTVKTYNTSYNNVISFEINKYENINELSLTQINNEVEKKQQELKPKKEVKTQSKKNITVGSVLKTLNGDPDEPKKYNGFSEFKEEFDRWYNVMKIQKMDESDNENYYDSGVDILKEKVRDVKNWIIVVENELKEF